MSDTYVYQDIPDNKLGGRSLTNWSRRDLIVLLISVAASFATLLWIDPIIALFVTSISVALNYRFATGFGRGYDEVLAGVKGIYITHVLHGVLYDVNDHVREDDGRYVNRGLAAFLRRHNIGIDSRSTLPFDFVRVRVRDTSFTVLRDRDTPYDHIVIAAAGGAFAGLDPNAQQRAVSALADTTNHAIAKSDLKAGFSYLLMNGPLNGAKLIKTVRSMIDPIIAMPDAVKLGTAEREYAERMRRNFDQVISVINRSGAAETWHLIVLSIRRTYDWDRAARGKVSSKELYELPLADLARSLVQSLQSNPVLGLGSVRCLGTAELASEVRCGWDFVGIKEYYRAQENGEIPTSDEEIDALITKGEKFDINRLRPLPEHHIKVNGKEGYAQFDGNYLAVVRVTQLPGRVRADEFKALHAIMPAGVWVRQAMVGSSVSGDAETTQYILGQSARLNLNKAFKGNRIVADPRDKRKQQALAEQADQLSIHSVSQHFNMLFTIVAADPDLLRRQTSELRARLLTRGFRSEQVKATARIVPAVISGILGVNRL